MNRIIGLRNRQHTRPLDGKMLRRIARALLVDVLEISEFELGIHLVAAPEMALLNETFLQHAGSTDVITFDHSSAKPGKIHGEIFICVDDAVAQARRFRTTWQNEVVRYFVHGVLHLLGHDDLEPPARRRMKRKENRLAGELSSRFAVGKIAGCRAGRRGAKKSLEKR